MMKTLILVAAIFWAVGCGTDHNPFDGNDKVEINAAEGDQGPSGENGTNGTDGSNGKDGERGLNGRNGTSGKNGKDGTNGENGEDGRDGLPGSQGPRGNQGSQGPRGTDGQSGTNGQPCKIMDHGSYIMIMCPGSNPVNIDKPTETLTICTWINWCIQTVSAKISDINSGMYNIEHIGPCRQ